MVALLFGMVEFLLGLANVEPPYMHGPTFNPNQAPFEPFVEWVQDGETHVETNTEAARYDIFAAETDAGSFRVFTLGGSSTYGTNYPPEEAWPGVVARRLAVDHPGAEVEVINAGVTGALSDDLVHYTRQVGAYMPDLVILYTGYNDFTYLPQLARFRAFDPRSMAVQTQLSGLRLATVVRDVLSLAPPVERLDEFGGYLDEQELTEADRALLWAMIGNNLARNLRFMVGVVRDLGGEVLLVSQAQNEQICAQLGQPGGEAGEGTCSLPLVREVTAAVAAELGVPLLDGQAALQSHAGGPAAGGYFYDPIHLTRLGNEVLGAAVAPAAAELLELGAR